jgi:predicted Zn-dependent peptidase
MKTPMQITQTIPKVKIIHKKTDQTHSMMGFHTNSVQQSSRYISDIASTILGGYMSSRLFTEIREKRGLSYYIRAYSQYFDDTGVLSINTGIKSSKVSEVITRIIKEIQSMKQNLISDKELAIAKEHIKGQMVMEFESSDEIASIVGIHQITFNQPFDLQQEISQYDQVTKQDILEWMQEYAQAHSMNLVIIGNISQSEVKPITHILETL